MAFPIGQQHAAVFEALGAEGRDPQVTVGLLDVGGDHTARAEIKPELNRDEHNRKQDADKRNREANPIVYEIT